MLAVVAPLDQVKAGAPDALRTTLPPWQKAVGLDAVTVTEGVRVTDTVKELTAEDIPPSVVVTE